MRIALFDYGAGNLHSLAKALAETGHAISIESDPLLAIDAELFVLPGVGAFQPAAERLPPPPPPPP
ncbi:MAG TPA: imidazole glycerol phosphate synthase subunit HisH, partial [Gemmatimonadaceae bacterium]|nr:imidazole glycerol phosphate synthase subunit HisH [Gemmatimonadaceae bacterium]